MPKPEQLGVGLRRWGGAQSKGSAQQQLSGLQKPPALHLCLHWGWWSSQQPPPALRPQGAGPPACPSLRPATVRKEGVLWSVCMAVWAPRGPPGRLWGRTSVREAWDHHCGWEGKDAGRAEAWPCRSSGARRPGEAIILGHLVSAARAGHCVTWREPHSGGRVLPGSPRPVQVPLKLSFLQLTSSCLPPARVWVKLCFHGASLALTPLHLHLSTLSPTGNLTTGSPPPLPRQSNLSKQPLPQSPPLSPSSGCPHNLYPLPTHSTRLHRCHLTPSLPFP